MIGFYVSKSLSIVLGFIYPAYKSFKAIQSPCEKDDTQWLTYWSVFAFLVLIEYYFEWVLNFLPFYYEIKIFFLLWLALPIQSQLGGASFLYSVYIHPFLSSREKVIDSVLTEMGLPVESVKCE